MGFVKLTEPGSSHTLHVRTVTENKSGNWPDWEFSDGTDTVSVPQKAADRQLARLNVASALQLVGATLKVSRSEKAGANGKYFWNLDIVSAAAAHPPQSKRLPPPERTAKTAHSAGPRVPEIDDEPQPYQDEPIPAWHHAPPPEDPEMDGPWDTEGVNAMDPHAEPALTPREERERDADESPRAAFLKFYVDTYAEMLAGLSAVHSAASSANVGPRSRAPEAIPPLTSDTVQAAVATYVIQCDRRGWLSK